MGTRLPGSVNAGFSAGGAAGDRPADFGVVIQQVVFVAEGEVTLADRATGAKCPLGYPGSERAVGPVEIPERAGVQGDREFRRRDLVVDDPAASRRPARRGDVGDELSFVELEELAGKQRPVRSYSLRAN